MSGSDGIFSLRLVIADFYMEKPVTGLDPCYSEFRSKEIKKVPIIRIFGSNAQGQKTCMHVHGVFPYFYIPYDQKDFESLNKAIYQVAINLDRAINISLSQGSSSAQHVFKVQLVKGIPFYGYHRSDHQFLKIYMFNPRFVRRAANLLQNGAIMNKNFHPHESHVPYILQFMIDYNLYGMSFLHVPLEIVKFRRCDANAIIPFRNIQESQLLDCNLAKKISCSSLEVDIASSFILNRFQIIAKTNSAHTNPGIESIWNDERLRRQKLAQTFEQDEEKLKTIPPLEIPSTQERPNVHSTESEIFYRTALLEKLLALETSSLESSEITDQTINYTLSTTTTNISTTTLNSNNLNSKPRKRTFNLSKILQNSVYPEECSQNDNLINASVIQNHLSNNNVFQQSIIVSSSEESKIMEEMTQEDESVFLENTIIDEELVLSLTQNQNHHSQQQKLHVPMNATLREEDMELLDILQHLEENNEDKIDLDSSLAPLSQTHHNFALSPQQLDKETTASVMPQVASDVESEGENENDNVHDFSIALDSLDDLILKLTQTQQQSQNIANESLPQTDGSDDVPKTPTKLSASLRTKSPPRTPTTPKNRRATLAVSPSRSPRTPKTGHKYAPLPLVIINRSTGKKTFTNDATDTTPSKEFPVEKDNLPIVSLRKKLALTEIRRKSISVDRDVPDHSTVMAESSNTTKRRSKRFKDLDKTHVTCALTPRRTNNKILKVYSFDNKDTEVDEIKEDKGHASSSVKTEVKTKNEIPMKTAKESEIAKTVSNAKEMENIRKMTKKNTKQREIKQSNEKDKKATLDIKILNSKDKTIENNTKLVERSKMTDISKDEDNNFSKFNENVNTNIDTNVNKDIPNNVNTNEISPASETDEEILNSDTETENSIKQLKKTPNLKRLRRSFLATKSTKRRRLTIKNLDNIVNSSKFENPNDISNNLSKVPNFDSVDVKSTLEYENPDIILNTLQEVQSPKKNSANTKIPVKVQKCCVKLRKLPIVLNKFDIKGNVNESKEIEDVNKIRTRTKNKCNFPKHPKTSEQKKCAEDFQNFQNFQNVNKNSKTLEKLRNCKVDLEIDPIEIEKSDKSGKRNESLEHPQLSEFNKDKCDLNQSNKTDSLERLQLSSGSSENFDKSNVSLDYHQSSETIKNLCGSLKPQLSKIISKSQISTLEVEHKSLIRISSDEEITETPPKEYPHHPKALNLSNKSLNLHSPVLFTQNSSPIFLANAELQRSKSASKSNSLQSEVFIILSSSNDAISNAQSTPPLDAKLVLTPLDLPPSRDEVSKGCYKLQLPEFEFQRPFYSNPDDITKHKELGFTVLQIPGNKLNDTEEFQSILGPDIKGLSAWRREQLLKLAGPEVLNKYRNAQRIREYLALPKTVAITPQINAPTRQEIKLWLKARELIKNKGEKLEDYENPKTTEEDSPIKVRRQKVTMMLNGGTEGDSDDGDNTLDCSSRSLTLTPLTPGTPVVNNSIKVKLNESFTPVTTRIEKIPLKCNSAFRKHKNLRVLRRISLTKKLNEAVKSENFKKSDNSFEEKNARSESQESVISNSQTSETSVSSQTALQELERSSFMRNLQQHDVTIGGLSNDSSINNTFGFKVALENLQQAKADVEFNYLTIITLEVFVATRDDLYPNPEIDEIRCLFYAIENSIPNEHMDCDKKLPRKTCGYIMVHDSRDIVDKEGRKHGIDRDIEVTIVQTEVEALEALLGLCSRWDPDIYAGYEIEMSSWGFIIERAKYLCLNIAPLLSRVPTQKVREFVDEDRETFTDLDVEMKLCGRILLDVWRLLRSEIALTSYTFENVMYHIMHKRCPWHSYRTLTEWFASPCSRWIVLEYYLERVRGTLSLLDQLDLIGRTSEMAKLIGIQFYEVLSRGSQFRVESMMLRIAKPKNLVPLSPSVQQRAHMRAPEYLALILEPQSRFYADPVIVLDFQSLYPSMIIGYNYCFSTCLGRVEHLGQSTPFEFGASQLRVSPSMLRKLVDRDLITISPCGVVFVKSSVREGILPRMLTEILDTRQMVKQSMKLHKSNSALQRILHSRQLGLKLMANVTYGYTAANFSGRMPSVEVGDTVVSKGRETLERAIKMVEANDKWNVKVVYGDTDSMFVLVPGRNREEAFRIGEEIADAVTKQNPHPVKLKLEKVYQPCILQTKKRYVGYMYETADQKEPVYEAKGIETVRRDGCPLVAKMLEKVLRILFESADVSQVKQYVCRQFTKLLSGRANLQDLIFAKEFRGLNGYKPTACVPSLELTRKWIQNDPRRIPRRGERVPFIITNGPPGVPLIRLIRHPHEVLADEGLKMNAIYYITKAIIPPLNRCLLLIGADVNEWFTNLPRKILLTPALSVANEVISCPNNTKSKKSTISQFFSTTNCIVDCGRQTKQGVCSECNRYPTRSMVVLQNKISKIERSYLSTQQICQSCCGRVGDLNCGSLNCPVLYVAEVKRRDLQQIIHFRNLLEELF